jgi:hypothetical protein
VLDLNILFLCLNVFTRATCFNTTKRPSLGWYSNEIENDMNIFASHVKCEAVTVCNEALCLVVIEGSASMVVLTVHIVKFGAGWW